VSFSSSSRPPDSGARRAAKGPVAGPNRLPATRERRPALAALAVILILLGAAGSALIAIRSGDREYYVAVSKDIEQGTKIKESDLARASLAGDTAGLVPWSEAKKYVNRYTTTKLVKNQLVTSKSFSEGDAPDVPNGGGLVGLSLDDGKLPSDGVSGGDIVRVIRIPAANSEGQPEVLVTAAEVTRSEDLPDKKTATDDSKKVTVLVPADKATKVAAAASTKTIVLVKLPDNTKPEVARTDGGG
jgi:hypothetical protein